MARRLNPMRSRLQRFALLVAFIGVVGYAVPMMYATVTGLHEGAQEQLNHRAVDLATHLEQRTSSGEPITLTYLQKTGAEFQRVEVEYRGQTLSIGSIRAGALRAEAASGALRVTLWGSDAELRTAVLRVLLLSLGYGAVAAFLAWLFARNLAIRLGRPIAELVDAANRIGLGDARASQRRYGVPELDLVAEVLDKVSTRVQRLLLVERQLGSELSHQLRTPLTALQLQLDEILEVADDPAAVRAEAERASRQIDRITMAMRDLTAARRGADEVTGSVDLATALAPVVADIRLNLANRRRPFYVDLPAGLETPAAAGAVRHVLSILLENAVEHGVGAVTMSAYRAGEWLVVKVVDEGPGLDRDEGLFIGNLQQGLAELGRQQTNIGLPLAIALAVGQRGRIEWRESEPAALRVYLPSAAEDPTPVGVEAE